MEEIKVNRKIEINKFFKISRMKEVIKPTKPHKHEGYFEIIFLSEGAGVHIIDEHNYSVEPPLLFYMNPGHVHCWEFSKIPKGYVCIFKEVFLSAYPDIKLIFSKLSTKYNLPQKNISIESDFKLMREEYERDYPDLDILRHYLIILLLKMSHFPIPKGNVQTEVNPTLFKYRQLIEEHYIEEKNLEYYADKLSVSKRVLNSTCKKEIGRSASSLISERIIVESKRLLKHSNNSISEIAYHLNFNDPSHFAKFFKGKTNLTPGQFRDKL
ncbi:helix-turn-helix domain-containing protein [Saccharicrinis aurantiacus]|uniref:helix-turn-helix domain-containing protein n=1 Tax=Saccharicrinis aurantiacus TaxID=1849719 RepID=UPI0024936FE3|nr:AraC family transcriptional regulator [Saccharicrinis aurantiacus]